MPRGTCLLLAGVETLAVLLDHQVGRFGLREHTL
jgi:hypothetical protein